MIRRVAVTPERRFMIVEDNVPIVTGFQERIDAERRLAEIERRDPDLVGDHFCQTCGMQVDPAEEFCPSCCSRHLEGPFFKEL